MQTHDDNVNPTLSKTLASSAFFFFTSLAFVTTESFGMTFETRYYTVI